ncbi:hypothetical protein ACIGZH_04375 [Streptomyces sp. NPDC058319]|uniref:hypothetical protein n=1 Tax=unclassified Streptomyces TaxID=2593676 RepID=UPI0036E64311
MQAAVRTAAVRTAGALTAVIALLTALIGTAGAARAAAALPGGKANWVVSVGYMDLASKSNYRNWVRLGYYAFQPDGTVVTNYWSWNQRDQPVRANALTADCGGEVPTCPVRTVEGFTGDPTGGFRGTFGRTSDGRLAVTWTATASGAALAQPLTEYWNLTTGLADGKAARITSPTFYGAYGNDVTVPAAGAFSSYTANFGVGYGSNASLSRTSRATMSRLVQDARYGAEPYRGAFVVAKASSSDPATRQGIVGREGTGGGWTFGAAADPWRLCGGDPCMGWVQHNTSCAAADGDTARVRYIGEVGGGRRNTEEYWCRTLAQGQPCYAYNSHPRPLLQVIDDSGEFQGWVGVEAFTHVATRTGQPDGNWIAGYWGIFDMVSADLKPEIPS